MYDGKKKIKFKKLNIEHKIRFLKLLAVDEIIFRCYYYCYNIDLSLEFIIACLKE